MRRDRIRSRVRVVGVNPYVRVTAAEAALLKEDWRGPMPVRYVVEGGPDRTWRINLMPLGDGSYRLHLNGTVRKASGLAVGDQVGLGVEFDDEYRGGPQHPMPGWFRDELAKDRLAKLGWGRLPPSRRKEMLRYFAQLKSEQARERNLRRAMHVLAGAKARFMGRSWNDADDLNRRNPYAGDEGPRGRKKLEQAKAKAPVAS